MKFIPKKTHSQRLKSLKAMDGVLCFYRPYFIFKRFHAYFYHVKSQKLFIRFCTRACVDLITPIAGSAIIKKKTDTKYSTTYPTYYYSFYLVIFLFQ